MMMSLRSRTNTFHVNISEKEINPIKVTEKKQKQTKIITTPSPITFLWGRIQGESHTIPARS